MPGSFEIVDQTAATPSGEGAWRLEPPPGEGAFATFELPEQMVGFPFLTVEAPAGTVVELMTQESHDPAGPAWLDTHRFSWARFVCREGENRFEAFDYESLRFLQVHVHEAAGPVLLRDVGVRRRSYPWPKAPSFTCAEPRLQRVFEASFNTLVNAAQETIVDGMGRERQQYSGDGAHQLHATRLVCGDRAAGPPLPADVPHGPDAGRVLPRLLAGLRPPEPDRAAAGAGRRRGGRSSTTG